MAKVEVVMPKMGESVMEGTVLTWYKQPGESIELDETLLEIGTDKVDSEIPSPAEGILEAIVIPEGETVEVGTIVAIINTSADASSEVSAPAPAPEPEVVAEPDPVLAEVAVAEPIAESVPEAVVESVSEPVAEPELQVAAVAAASAGAVAASSAPVSTGGSLVDVVMPKMGESVMEGTVLSWFKEVGDSVDLDETLLEIGTDKVDSEIPSPAGGIVQEILIPEGETVEVGTILARLGSSVAAAESATPPTPEPVETVVEEEIAEPIVTPANDAVAVPPVVAPIGGDGSTTSAPSESSHDVIKRQGQDGRFYSPLVRSIAEAEGLSATELEGIQGSGKDGRVTKKDILGHIESKKAAPPAPSVPVTQTVVPITAPVAAEPAEPAPLVASEATERIEVIKMDRMRRIISDHMTKSLATAAHVTSFAEADLTNLVTLRNRVKWEFEAKEGIKLTMTPFFVKAVVEALREFPMLNSMVEGDNIIIKKDLNVGIAVAIAKTGLIVPVIRDAGSLNISGLAKAAGDLATRARSKGLTPDELQGGTFTVSNVGSLGSIMGTPIINQPQVGILATGAIKKRPVVIEDPDKGDMIAIRHMMILSLSYDHRIIDGAMGVAFLNKIVEVLESFSPDAHDLYQ